MKKKVLFLGLLLAAVVTVSFQSYSGKSHLEDLVLKNIDALASSSEWEGMAYCFDYGSVDCPSNHVKVKYVMEPYSLEDAY